MGYPFALSNVTLRMPQVLVSHEQSSKVLIFSKGVKTALLKIEWQNNEEKKENWKKETALLSRYGLNIASVGAI